MKPKSNDTEMPTRILGQTGERVSALGLGGFHIGLPRVTPKQGIRIIRSAIDRGLTFMDNSWDYNEGESEVRMGKALKDGYRDKVFLMTKVDGRTKKEAARQIDQSLKRLGVDHVDLLQHITKSFASKTQTGSFGAGGYAYGKLSSRLAMRASSAISVSPATKTLTFISTCWRKRRNTTFASTPCRCP